MGTPWRRGPPTPEEWVEVPFYRAVKSTAQAFVTRGFRIHPLDADRVPRDGGGIVAANHASYWDPIFLGAVIDRPVHYMAKSDLFRGPLLEKLFRSAGQVKIDRETGGNQAAVEACVDLVRRDRLVGIFPEGNRTLDGQVRPGRTGVARVALRTGAPVLPVALTSYDTLPKFARVPNLDAPLVVAFGTPRRYEDMQDLEEDRAACRKVTDEIMGEIGRLLEIARTKRAAFTLEKGET